MATIIVNHKVKDYATWKPHFDKGEHMRREATISLLAVGQKAGEPGNVYIVFKVDNMEKANQLMSGDELKQDMQEAGVISAPEILVIE